MSLAKKRLLTFGVIVVVAVAAGLTLPSMFLNYLLFGQVWR